MVSNATSKIFESILLDIFTNCVDNIDFQFWTQLTYVLSRLKVLLIIIDAEEVMYLFVLLIV